MKHIRRDAFSSSRTLKVKQSKYWNEKNKKEKISHFYFNSFFSIDKFMCIDDITKPCDMPPPPLPDTIWTWISLKCNKTPSILFEKWFFAKRKKKEGGWYTPGFCCGPHRVNSWKCTKLQFLNWINKNRAIKAFVDSHALWTSSQGSQPCVVKFREILRKAVPFKVSLIKLTKRNGRLP